VKNHFKENNFVTSFFTNKKNFPILTKESEEYNYGKESSFTIFQKKEKLLHEIMQK